MLFSRLSLLAGTASATRLLLPLYNDPGTDGQSWSSVQSALSEKSDVEGTIVINVDNGPGDPFSSPAGDNWKAGAGGLGELPNVSLIGYVHVTRCNRPLEEVKEDVTEWASWNTEQGINIDGIFVDEAPNESGCEEYLEELTSHIRYTAGLSTVVYNAGFPATPHALDAYYDLEPTFISALETCFATESNGEDLCDGTYTVYDAEGYGTTIDSTLREWVGVENYDRTAILVHGFHSTNGLLEANDETLLGLLEAVAGRKVGAAVFTTNHWVTPDEATADIGTMVELLGEANSV